MVHSVSERKLNENKNPKHKSNCKQCWPRSSLIWIFTFCLKFRRRHKQTTFVVIGALSFRKCDFQFIYGHDFHEIHVCLRGSNNLLTLCQSINITWFPFMSRWNSRATQKYEYIVFKLLPVHEATVVKWINGLPCKPGVPDSIPGFTVLSDETLSRGPVSIWP